MWARQAHRAGPASRTIGPSAAASSRTIRDKLRRRVVQLALAEKRIESWRSKELHAATYEEREHRVLPPKMSSGER
jgi:hypothetical protein